MPYLHGKMAKRMGSHSRLSPRMFRPWQFPLAALAALFVAGCGGGGGSTGGGTVFAPGDVSYLTEWSGRADPIGGSGQSQVITIQEPDGDNVASLLLNRASGDAIVLPDIPGGEYLLVANLFSGVDANGARLGEIRMPVTVNGAVNVQTSVGSALSRIRVNPGDVLLENGASRSFYATAFDASNRAVFTESSAFGWSVLGGVGNVTSGGVFTASNLGEGQVRATHTASGLTGSARVSVAEPNATRSEWTVLVYINAANDLYLYSDLNVDQMERVANNPDLRFVVQWKQSREIFSSSSFDGTRRLLVQPNNQEGVQSPVVQQLAADTDMGLPETLNDFIQWGKARYPANRYALIVWNHGSGWNRSARSTRAVSFDDQTGNAIQTWEIPQALDGHRFDILAWDASLMQMLEVAYEARPFADFVIGSEESPPGEGYPYDAVFAGFRDNPKGLTRTLSKGFVDGMLNNPPYASRKITQSVLDTAQLDELALAMDNAAGVFLANESEVLPIFKAARTAAQSYSPTIFRYYRDLKDLFIRVRNSASSNAVRTACDQVIAAADAAIVWEGHNANSAGSTGISIEASPRQRFGLYASDYRLTQFGQDTRWDEWLLRAD